MYLNLNFSLGLVEGKGNEIATSQVLPLSKSIYIYHRQKFCSLCFPISFILFGSVYILILKN